jgi:hypothetical protein
MSNKDMGYTEREDMQSEVSSVIIAKDAEIERLRSIAKESLRCLKEAKRQWAPSTTNSDADSLIERIETYLEEKDV